MREVNRNFALSFQKEINQNNQFDFLEILSGRIVDSILPAEVYNLSLSMEITSLQLNYFLPSLKKNPLPEIDDLQSETVQTAAIIEHKEKYNPLNGYAIELSFYRDYSGDLDGWQKLGREYFYNLGIEQYQSLLTPYFTLNDSITINPNEKIGAKITLPDSPELSEEDTLVFSGNLKGSFTCFTRPSLNLEYDHGSGVVGFNEVKKINGFNRFHLLISNYGPGRLYFSFGKSPPAMEGRTSWVNPNQSILFESTSFSATNSFSSSNSVNMELFNFGVLPNTDVYLSSDSQAEFGFYQIYVR